MFEPRGFQDLLLGALLLGATPTAKTFICNAYARFKSSCHITPPFHHNFTRSVLNVNWTCDSMRYDRRACRSAYIESRRTQLQPCEDGSLEANSSQNPNQGQLCRVWIGRSGFMDVAFRRCLPFIRCLLKRQG